jgi:hypothetical protein
MNLMRYLTVLSQLTVSISPGSLQHVRYSAAKKTRFGGTQMRRVSLLALLALALPVAASADSVKSVDFQFGQGIMLLSGADTVSVVSAVDSISVNGGPFELATGNALITMTLNMSPAGNAMITGGGIFMEGDVNGFSGTIDPGGIWTVLGNGKTGAFVFGFQAFGELNGTPMALGVTSGSTVFTGGNPFAPGGSGQVSFNSGDTFAQVQVLEPGTLSLLGTGGFGMGFVGIVGFLRRQLRTHV